MAWAAVTLTCIAAEGCASADIATWASVCTVAADCSSDHADDVGSLSDCAVDVVTSIYCGAGGAAMATDFAVVADLVICCDDDAAMVSNDDAGCIVDCAATDDDVAGSASASDDDAGSSACGEGWDCANHASICDCRRRRDHYPNAVVGRRLHGLVFDCAWSVTSLPRRARQRPCCGRWTPTSPESHTSCATSLPDWRVARRVSPAPRAPSI